MKILVIGDSHINPDNVDESCDNFHKLALYCCKTKPDAIVHLGDVADLKSLSWLIKDRGVYTTEEELEAVKTCLFTFEQTLAGYNNYLREIHKKLYRPQKYLTLGNHDTRNGYTGISDLFETYQWTVADYLQPVTLDDVTFCHLMYKGLSSNPCLTAEELLANWHSNIIVGHGHHRDFSESYSFVNCKQITALKSPCFMSEPSDWALQTCNKWSLGFTEVDTNPFSFTWRTMKCLSDNC